MKLLFILILSLASWNIYGQTIISGSVRDAETKEPLDYTTISILGKAEGIVANSQGEYELHTLIGEDTVVFYYLGYHTYKVPAQKLRENPTVYLKPSTLNLNEIQVLSKSLTPEDIIKKIEENYPKNYSSNIHKQKLFFHKHEKIPVSKQNKIVLKKSNFSGLDPKTFHELFNNLPQELHDFQEAILEVYSDEDDFKVVPIKGVAVVEGAQKDLYKEFEKKMGSFIEGIEKSKNEEGVYYKLKTGIFGFKMKPSEEDGWLWEEYKKDSLHYPIPTDLMKGELLFLYQDYAHMDSKNWEFVHQPKKYEYTLDELAVFQNETVYKISFHPKKQGLFTGTMFVSTTTYAILQLDFAFANGKQTENIHLFGFGHAMKYKLGRVVYEKGQGGYFVKYIKSQQHEFASIDRTFSILKKQKRFFIDKELNEIKIDAEVSFDVESTWEILVLDREEISKQHYDKIEEPSFIKLKREISPIENRYGQTELTPVKELQKYKATTNP